jgi:mannose-6-phosphate isomerase-like protein (cupin superfamily)
MDNEVRVLKQWGEELWLANDNFCCKKLTLYKGYRCSLHYHKKKDELFFILSGKVLFELDGKQSVLLPGDSIRVKPLQQHRFSGLWDSFIMESSTHHEEEDSFRVEPSGKFDITNVKL